MTEDDFKNDDLVNDSENADRNYNFNDISTIPIDYDVDGVVKRLLDRTFTLPDYQRAYTWDIKKASLFIETLLTGLPFPPIYMHKRTDNERHIIDGYQRLLTILLFRYNFFPKKNEHPFGFNDYISFAIKKENNEEISTEEYEKFTTFNLDKNIVIESIAQKNHDRLDIEQQKIFRDAYVRCVTVQTNKNVEQKILVDIFNRLNTGGVPLEPQEIRACLFFGKLNNFLKNYAKKLDVSGWGLKRFKEKRGDEELVLRLLTFSKSLYHEPIKGSLSQFFDDFMDKNRNPTEDKLLLWGNEIDLIMSKVYREQSSIIIDLTNKSVRLMETVYVAFYKIMIEEKKTIELSENLIIELKNLFNQKNGDFFEANKHGYNHQFPNIKKRIDLTFQLLQKYAK